MPSASTPAPALISKWVMDRVFRSGLRPLDQREFLGNVLTLEFALRHFPAPGVTDPQALAKAMIGLEPSDTLHPEHWRVCTTLISEFGGQLRALLKDYRAVRVKVLPRLKGAPVGLVLVPVWIESGKTLRLRFAVLADELPGVLHYALSLLLDEEFGAQLCRCELPECGRFFLAAIARARGRRPGRTYCSVEHMTLAHDQSAARRVARARKKKAAIARKRRKRAAPKASVVAG
jgi:hypothetical protein